MVTLDPVFYYFVFRDKQTQREYKTYLTRVNSNNDRYGEFNLITPTDLALPSGMYEYFVYENDNNTDTDEDEMTELETGNAVVLGTEGEITAYDAPELIADVYTNS